MSLSILALLKVPDSSSQICWIFFTRKTVGRAMQTKYFLDGRLACVVVANALIQSFLFVPVSCNPVKGTPLIAKELTKNTQVAS